MTGYRKGVFKIGGYSISLSNNILLDDNIENRIIMLTEPTTPLVSSATRWDFLFIRCFYVSVSKTNINNRTANTILYRCGAGSNFS